MWGALIRAILLISFLGTAGWNALPFIHSRLADAVAAVPGFTNPDPDSTVLVVPMDGRPAQAIARVQRGVESFVPLGSLASALGVPFAWDPYKYRGWISTDSIRTEFTLDSPILNHGGESVQIQESIGYGARGVLIPLDYLSLLTEQWHGRRPVSWRPAMGIFKWGADAPAFRQVRVGQVGHQSVIKIPMRVPPRASSLLWSPVGKLDVFLAGVGASPDSLVITGGAHGGALLVRGVTGAAEGSRIRLDVAPEARGVSVAYDAHDGAWQLSTSSSRDEIGRGGFRGLQQADRPRRDSPESAGPVVIAPFYDRATDPAEADSALASLADRVARTLADTLLLKAEVLTARDPVNAARTANGIHASCVIALRLDRYATGTGKLQVWAAAPRLRWEPVDLTQALKALPPRPLLWSETPALTESESRRLASTLASHLGSLLGNDRIEVGSRPSRWLEGFTMPALLIYPAQTNDPISIERLLDDAQRADLARAIAFAISEAIAMGEGSTGLVPSGGRAR